MSRHFPMRWAGPVLGGRLVLTAARSHRAQAPRIPPPPHPTQPPTHPPTNSPCPSLICNPSSTAKIILSAPPYISFERCAYHHHIVIITVHPRSLVVSAGEIGGRKIISGLQRLNVFGSGLPAWERIIIKQQLGLHHFFSFSFRERGEGGPLS